MTKHVMISIRGLQEYEGVDNDSIEFVTAGTLTSIKDGFNLSYAESELTGMQGTITSFDIIPNRVVLTRTGPVCSEMVFEAGRRHLSLYQTPYGSMEVGIRAKKMRCTMDEHGGELEIVYSIDIDHAMAGENRFLIKVRESKSTVPQ